MGGFKEWYLLTVGIYTLHITSIRRVLSVGASAIQTHGPAQFFQVFSANRGLKISSFPLFLGLYLLCGASKKTRVFCGQGWGCCLNLSPFLSPSVNSVDSVDPLLPSLWQSAWCYPLFPPSPSSLWLGGSHLERHYLKLCGETPIQR